MTGEGNSELRHEFVRAGPWDWTCQRCGYVVRPTSRLDNALSRVQAPRFPAIVALLVGELPADPAAARLARAIRLGTLTVGSVAVVAIAVTLGNTGGPAAPGSSTAGTPPVMTTLSDVRAGANSVGHAVVLSDVPVDSVTGDVTFWIGSGDERVLVIIDETRQPERAVTVRPGQRVRIRGTIARGAPEDIPLSRADRIQVEGQSAYVLADHVEILN